MLSFFEKLKIKIESEPDLVVLRSEHYPDGITYKQLDEMSGRVCGYLKAKEIGKEDFVMVLMPREVTAYIAVIGVWKSGAAMTLLEEDYSPKRVEYIKNDLNCKLVITREVFEEMMLEEVCREYDFPDEHDACYAAYTSGSTGHPKGIIHEFGKLDLFDYDYRKELAHVEKGGRFAIITPLNFGPSIRNAVTSLIYGKCLYIVPQYIVKNSELLLRYFIDNRISETSATASFANANQFSTEYLKNIFVHSEPCNGVFFKGPNIINLYTLSEVVFPVFTCKIDRAYDTAPVGHANGVVIVRIIDENGADTEPFKIGEIIVEDPYTRGYLNLPDKTSEAFRDGFFYTGDLGYTDENGLCFLCGRKDDMIKINGNRIEPAEIELNVKKVLNVKNAVSKGFSDEKHSFVAVYLLKDELEEKGLLDSNGRPVFSAYKMKKFLENVLPSYMIPSYYIVIDEFPKNGNGKISRKDLPKPEAEEFLNEYKAPQSRKERYFCRLFEKALRIEKVGVNDDFYEIGGDSLSAINVVSLCTEYKLSADDLFNFRTPRNLAQIVTESSEINELNNLNSKALRFPQPLLPEQRITFDSQTEFPDYVANNLVRLFRLKKGTDAEKFRNAVDKVLKSHPVFSTILINDNGIVKMLYKPELFKETKIISVSTDKLEMIQKEQRRPFRMENSLLYRHTVYQCEDSLYFFFEIHHIITDGISLKNLFCEIENTYNNSDYIAPKDYFYLVAQKSYEKRSNEKKQDNNAFFDLSDYRIIENNSIRMDCNAEDFVPAVYERVLQIDKRKITGSSIYEKYKGNVFFMTCFLKAIAEYNRSDKAFTFWVFSGRDDAIKENVHGMMIHTLPMDCDFSKEDINGSLEYVRRTVIRGLSQSGSEFVEMINDEDFYFCPYFIYQNNILNSECGVFEEEIEMKNGGFIFEFHLIDNSDCDCFQCKIKYLESVYRPQSIERFCEIFEKTAENLIL